jgi:glycosyltransferase involved in cell wall biosynthesis
LVGASDRVPVSIWAWADLLRRDHPGTSEKVIWSPVGSNIRPTGERAPRGDRPRIGVFSPLGSGKDPLFVEEVWARLGGLDAELVLIGVSRDQWPGKLVGDPRCRFTGEIPEREVSRELAALDVFIAPFVDGISARRTSVIAAFAHGVPVVSNWGRLTDPIFTEAHPGWLEPKEAGAFASAVLRLLRNPEAKRMRAWIGQSLYERYFDWDVVAARLLGESGVSALARKVPSAR